MFKKSVHTLIALCGLSSALCSAKTIKLTSYNIKNLPTIRIIPGMKIFPDRLNNLSLMPKQLCRNDLLLLQEDFWYPPQPALIPCFAFKKEARKSGSFKPIVSLPTFLNKMRKLKLSDGLSTYSNLQVLLQAHQKWSTCEGTLRFANDCFAEKGFSFQRLDIQKTQIDVYNLHMDAGDDKKSRIVRSFQFQQLLRYVELKSAHRPVIIAGDFNEGFSNENLSNFAKRLRLKDACKNCVIDSIDKILFRSEERLRLVDFYVDSNLSGFSDHQAIVAEFDIAKPAL